MKTATRKTTKTASNLTPGDVMPPPARERGWLKNNLTVLSVSEGKTDKRGLWLDVRVSYQSPYNDSRISESVFSFRPETEVTVLN